MDYLSNTTGGFIEKLGKSFLLAGYLPAVLYMLIHYSLLLPIWFDHSFDGFVDQTVRTIIPNLAILLLIPLGIGILLLSLNFFIIRIYEGRLWILRGVLLWPFQRYYRNLCQKRYGEIVGLKIKMREVLISLEQEKTTINSRRKYQQQIDALALQIETAYERLESKESEQYLPLQISRVAPTQLGNIFAVIEEYPYDRYGIDAVLLWPRLRSLLDEAAPHQAERLNNQKIILDMTLNLSLLFALIALEAVFTPFLTSGLGDKKILLILFLAGTFLSWLCYQAGLSAARTYGHIVMTCFDFYRGLVLDKFGIKQPTTLLQEQVVWLKLAAFLRRGESFYWPLDGQLQKKISHKMEAEQHEYPDH
jgi:hypothetical protein